MGDCCVGEEDDGDCRNVLLELSELLYVKSFVPSDVYKDLDASIKLEKRLRCAALGLSACQWSEVEHGEGGCGKEVMCVDVTSEGSM